MRARLVVPHRHRHGGLGSALALEAVSRLGNRAEPFEGDGLVAAFARPVDARRNLRERAVDLLELVPIVLADTVEETGPLAARLELCLTILLDGAEIGFQAIDVVEERALPVQQLAANGFKSCSGNRGCHRAHGREWHQSPCQLFFFLWRRSIGQPPDLIAANRWWQS
jgi:hypothetical protein